MTDLTTAEVITVRDLDLGIEVVSEPALRSPYASLALRSPYASLRLNAQTAKVLLSV